MHSVLLMLKHKIIKNKLDEIGIYAYFTALLVLVRAVVVMLYSSFQPPLANAKRLSSHHTGFPHKNYCSFPSQRLQHNPLLKHTSSKLTSLALLPFAMGSSWIATISAGVQRFVIAQT